MRAGDPTDRAAIWWEYGRRRAARRTGRGRPGRAGTPASRLGPRRRPRRGRGPPAGRRRRPDRDQRVHDLGPTALPDLLGQRVEPDERVRPVVQRPGPDAATCASRLWAISETCDFDNLLTPSVSTSFSTRRVETPSR